MTPPPPAPDERPVPAEGERERLAQLRLRLPVPGCSECLRLAQTTLGSLQGVVLVEAIPASSALSVTYEPGRVDPVDLRSAAQQAGCTST